MLRVVEEAYRSDTGRQRHANEDAYYARAPMFAVADGMGGAQAGEVAARVATEVLESTDARDEAPERYLRRVVRTANERIHALAKEDASRSGMGTTLTAALIRDDEVSVAHVGDSRAYLFRDGELKRLTSDHSLVEELRRQGRLTEAQAEEHPQRSVITRALGPEADVDVDTMTYSARDGDVFLLCSDGLTTMVQEPRIAEILARSASLDAAVRGLVREANERGGRDNITVVSFRLDEVDARAPAEGATLIGPTAEETGLTADAVREGAAEPPVAAPAAAGREPRRWPRTAAKSAVALLIVGALGAAGLWGVRQIYFLGTDEGGRLALYRGLPYELPLSIELYDERYSSPVQVDSLPADRRQSVTDHELRSRDDAVSLVRDLEGAARTGRPAAPRRGDGARDSDRGGAGRRGGKGKR